MIGFPIATVEYVTTWELDPELAEQLDKYHRAAAERARRLADQVDRSLLVMVNPVTLRPTNIPFPEDSLYPPTLEGPYQNATETEVRPRTGSLFNPLRSYDEFVSRPGVRAELVLNKIRSFPESSTVAITAEEMAAIDLLFEGSRPMRVAQIFGRNVQVKP